MNKRTGKSGNLLRDMAVISAVALVLGVIGNRTLLLDAWRGSSSAGDSRPASHRGEGEQPLPLGLMQVKDFFDRHEATFVDARESSAFRRGHIAGAVSLPVSQTAEAAPLRLGVPTTALIVVYCNGFGCQDSMTVGARLLRAGYRSVFVYEGGFPAWEAAGYPVERGVPRGQ